MNKGDILSELSFYKVEKIGTVKSTLVDDNGNKMRISNNYITDLMDSANKYEGTLKVSGTELAEIVLFNPRKAMTIVFLKADKKKTQKAFKAECDDRIEELTSASIARLPDLAKNLIINPVELFTKQEPRTIVGRHYGSVDSNGRLSFVDMKITTGMRDRLVDLRVGRLKSCIVNNTQYILK